MPLYHVTNFIVAASDQGWTRVFSDRKRENNENMNIASRSDRPIKHSRKKVKIENESNQGGMIVTITWGL